MIKRKGFTLIEIALFLAVTAALFIGIALGMQNAIGRQRQNDSVQNFFEFMRSIYSQVSNPQSAGRGNSEIAIYGKLVVFGENYDLDGHTTVVSVEPGYRPVFIYDVVGKAAGSQDIGSGDVSTLLYKLNANVIRKISSEEVELAYPEKYEPRWQTEILMKEGSEFRRFVGSILVVRHPRSGTINTLVLDGAIEVNQKVYLANSERRASRVSNMVKCYLKTDDESALETCRNYDPNKKFEAKELNFCMDSYSPIAAKQNIRLIKNARNASGVEMIETDSGNNKCK